ncbi:amidohydrolase family protein [Steroidobacter sp. S1-65]|uniref:Amidohydrolase family protein n=1 Tax=Steroidobacter gossypii TaxID=2805490 RepID=A0ABS1X0Y7_9GAMM|nr:amidohydrolase family protein [Steroidobacter gossypii]MBM0106867.1 amidohydrolase family protein [Steroidobacter gossypii]
MNIVVDAHVHLWDPARGDYGWLKPELTGLYRRFEVQELHALLEPAHVDGVVLVQAAPTAAETDYLLGIAEQTPWVFGVVGWIDFDAENVVDVVASRARHRKLVGVRPMLQDLDDPEWILNPTRAPALTALASHGLVFDALIHPQHIGAIEQIAERHPDLSIVIDHAAKPIISAQPDLAWRDGMRRLAARNNVACKLSGLLTQLVPNTSEEHVSAHAEVVMDLFGPCRTLWGSDWPVLTQAAPYSQWFELTQQILSRLSATERRAVLGGNAARIYHLDLRAQAAAILLHPADNVVVCCRPVAAGERIRIGEQEHLVVLDPAELGHKIARRALQVGTKVIKYGASIGSATAAVAAGGWVHLHNMKSDYISPHTRALGGDGS